MLSIQILGPFRASAPEGPVEIRSRRARALLGALALAPSRTVTRDGAAALLWPDRDETQARASLRQELAALRKALGPHAGILSTTGDRIELGAGVSFDVWAPGAPPGGPSGGLLEDIDLRSEPFEDWRRHQAAILQARFVTAAEQALARAEAGGDTDAALAQAEILTALDPLNESAVAARMRAALARGRRPEAVALLRDHAGRLATALQTEPGAHLARLLDAEDSAAPDPPPAPMPDIFARPAVLLMNFDCLSADPADQMIATGLVEYLRATLSCWRWFPVMGPEAAGWKTAQDVDIRAVAEDTGASYVVSGTVRCAGGRVRISATHTEAERARIAWTETFDGRTGDIFALQEDVACAIVARVEPQLARAAAERIALRPAGSPDAWELVARADEIDRKGGGGYGTRESNAAQLPLLQEATTREPDYSRAWARLARSHWRFFIMGWADDPAATIEASMAAARRGLEADPHEAEAHAYLALAATFGLRDHETGLSHGREAVRLNPSAPHHRHIFACVLENAGDFDAALDHLDAVFRLNPRHGARAAVLGDKTTCLMMLGRHAEAVSVARELMALAPAYGRGLQRCLASFGAAGEAALAAEACALLARAQPDLSEAYIRGTYPFRDAADLDRYVAAMRQGGCAALA